MFTPFWDLNGIWFFSSTPVPPTFPLSANGPQLGTDTGSRDRGQGLTGSGGPALARRGM